MKRNNVEEKTCEARMQTAYAVIDGLKRTIYVSAASMTTIIVFVQLILTFK